VRTFWLTVSIEAPLTSAGHLIIAMPLAKTSLDWNQIQRRMHNQPHELD